MEWYLYVFFSLINNFPEFGSQDLSNHWKLPRFCEWKPRLPKMDPKVTKFFSKRCWKIFFLSTNCDVLRNLVPFVQLKKREKHSWRCVTFSKALKVTLLLECFSRFLNCTNSNKSRNGLQLFNKLVDNFIYESFHFIWHYKTKCQHSTMNVPW